MVLKGLDWQVIKVSDGLNKAEELVFVKVFLMYVDHSGADIRQSSMLTVNEFYKFFNKIKELKECLK